MTPAQFKRIECVFAEACALSAEQRTTYVEQVLADDDELRGHVLSLLRHDERPAVALDPPVPGAARLFESELTARALGGAEPPQRIGSYRIISTIGEGGFGIVYLAEQDKPRRTVALKVLRPEVATPDTLRRFELEAHMLGRLRHPAIAQIYEAGVANDGAIRRAYFAMEYVPGVDLIRFATASTDGRSALSVHDRLELFAKVCDGLQHAHLNGIIHRDLKPANILVVDERALTTILTHEPREQPDSRVRSTDNTFAGTLPKILDFGVARAADGEAESAHTMMRTIAGQIVGTLTYMSPEQVSGEMRDIDTRSDVYSAGVMLYQLLTGQLPYEVHNIPIRETLRTICEVEPVPVGKLDGRLRGDIETMVSKAMAKDRTRRYQSASDLAQDIRRFLRCEPIIARSASTIYQLRMLAKRHKPAVFGMSLAVLALLLGAGGTTWQALRASRESRRAVAKARQSERVTHFLQNMLIDAQPDISKGREVTVREALDRAAQTIGDELYDEPEVEAAVRTTIGKTYLTLKAYPSAEEQFRAALELSEHLYGSEHVDVATNLQMLALARRAQGDYAEAEPLCLSALQLREKLLGALNPDYAASLSLYAEIQRKKANYPESEALMRRAIEIYTQLYGRQHDTVFTCLSNLGNLLRELYRYDEAEIVVCEAYEMARELYGSDHSTTIRSAVVLISLLNDMGRFQEVLPLARTARASAGKLYGDDNIQTAFIDTGLAVALSRLGDLDAAEPLARSTLAIITQSLPRWHITRVGALMTLAEVLIERHNASSATEAEQLLAEALILQDEFHPHTWMTARAQSLLGAALADLGRLDEAAPLLRDSVEQIRAARGPTSFETRQAEARLKRFEQRSAQHRSAKRG